MDNLSEMITEERIYLGGNCANIHGERSPPSTLTTYPHTHAHTWVVVLRRNESNESGSNIVPGSDAIRKSYDPKEQWE